MTKRFTGIFVVDGAIRRVTFEAADSAEAQSRAQQWNIGLEGEAKEEALVLPTLPEAYDLDDTRLLCGKVSRSTIYRWISKGVLERGADIRKVTITRRSIERGDWKKN